MPPKSNIFKYPDELLAYIEQCLDDPKITQSQTIEKVNKLIRDKYLGENELTTGTLGRYAKKRREDFEKAARYMASQKAMRDEFFDRFGDEGLDNAGRYSAELLYSFVMRLQTSLISIESLVDEGEVDYGQLDILSKVVQRISATIGNLEKSLSENKARIDAIKKEAKAQALEEASKTVEAALDDDGASAATIAKIKKKLLNL